MMDCTNEVDFSIDDPILRVFVNRNLLLIYLSFLIFGILPSIILGLLSGTFINNSLRIDMIHDIGFWSMNAIVFPFMGFYLFFYNRTLTNLFKDFKSSKLILIQEDAYEEFLKKIHHSFYNKYIYLIIGCSIIILSICLSQVFNLNKDFSDTWYRNPHNSHLSISNVWEIMLYIPFLYVICRLILNLILGCRAVFKLLRLDIDIQPLHYDRCGGMGQINKLALVMNGLILFIGVLLAIVISGFHNQFSLNYFHYINLLMICAYIICAAIIVFTPLLAAHWKMKEIRDETLLLLNHSFKSINSNLINGIKKNNKLDEQGVEEIERIQRFYEISSKFPTWPFNHNVLVTFFVSIMIPILTTFINWFISMLLSKL